MDKIKIYVEVEDGIVHNVYTDCSSLEFEVIVCDHDNAAQETENDGFDFEATSACEDLDKNRAKLIPIY